MNKADVISTPSPVDYPPSKPLGMNAATAARPIDAVTMLYSAIHQLPEQVTADVRESLLWYADQAVAIPREPVCPNKALGRVCGGMLASIPAGLSVIGISELQEWVAQLQTALAFWHPGVGGDAEQEAQCAHDAYLLAPWLPEETVTRNAVQRGWITPAWPSHFSPHAKGEGPTVPDGAEAKPAE